MATTVIQAIQQIKALRAKTGKCLKCGQFYQIPGLSLRWCQECIDKDGYETSFEMGSGPNGELR